jgi:hypothetical protein
MGLVHIRRSRTDELEKGLKPAIHPHKFHPFIILLYPEEMNIARTRFICEQLKHFQPRPLNRLIVRHSVKTGNGNC